ncbi:MAG: hypothetical protein A2Y96_00460 [Firmicutes bacterium RBG_13_65_8]|nr:MAG: hypothetical protein A2Y96_00460 [Firmicutes bacterium RBG_13_65_8]
MQYDLLLKGGLLVDPARDLCTPMDVGIENGKVAETSPSIPVGRGRNVLDVTGKMVMPGLIDTHVHVSGLLGGSRGYRMLARAGVTTALDCAGPVEDVAASMADNGSGINVAVLNAVRPGYTVSGESPPESEIADVVSRAIDSGAFGTKLMGGHYPLTPEATAGFIAESNRSRCYVAFHAGTTANGSNFDGFKEAIALCGGNSMHLAHINAYCRGLTTGDPVAETLAALAALERAPGIISEFHLATVNGTSGRCVDGVPESHITRTCLRSGGFEATRDGLMKAFLAGYAHVTADGPDGSNVLLKGEEGLRYWRVNSEDSTVGFPVNNRSTAFLCAAGRKAGGEFTINALSTDGGGIPRNFLLRYGLLLVEFGLWTLPEFVSRASYMPSRMLGLPGKGHLSPGADADVTVAGVETRTAHLAIAGGRVVMAGGVVTGGGGTIICNRRGLAALSKDGIPCAAADMDKSLLYCEAGE